MSPLAEQAADAEASSGLQANYYETPASAEAVAAETGAPAHSETDRQAALVSEVEDAGGEMRVHGAMPAEESDHANGTGAEETMAFQSVEPGSDGGPPDTPTTPSSQHQVHAQPAYSDPPAEMDASMATGGHDTNSTGMDQPPPHKLPAAGSVVTQVAASAQGVSAHTDSAAGQQSLLGADVSR